MQPEFTRPEFIENNSAEEIHQRMMNNLPADIDDMPGGFPYDFTMPTAVEEAELVQDGERAMPDVRRGWSRVT